MTVVNSARFEEGTLVVIDQESPAAIADAGWALNCVTLNRVGSLVAIHVEGAFGIGAAAPVTTLAQAYCPAVTVADSTGHFTLTPAGVLSYSGSTAAAGTAVAQFVFSAGAVSPS